MKYTSKSFQQKRTRNFNVEHERIENKSVGQESQTKENVGVE